MSDSRLEKFIYAICSMEVSDLPAPLSRIEILWNCLITGETPDFEPQSRHEIYLMAMLDRYDISNLPAPMSRGEKLLYKIAVGDTDLSDIPAYLSRYEELLGYLAENGTIDFKYVLYTLNQSLSTLYSTKEKPVKSAILKGQTLVNIITKNSGTISRASNNSRYNLHIPYHYKLTPNKKYYVTFKVSNITGDTTGRLSVSLCDGQLSNQDLEIKDGRYSIITTAQQSKEEHLNSLAIYFIANGTDTSCDISEIMMIEYQEGMENWDIPYFEGMTSVKAPVLKSVGKNLFDIGGKVLVNFKRIRADTGEYVYSTAASAFEDYFSCRGLDGNYMTITAKDRCGELAFYDKDKKFIRGYNNGINRLIPINAYFYRFGIAKADVILEGQNIQVEIGSAATPYEDHKSNILSTPEDLELRGFGKVKDELNCLTGEKVERIGEIVLDGSENWVTRIGGTLYSYSVLNFFDESNVEGLCDCFIFIKGGSTTTQKTESICSATTTYALSLFTNNVELSTVEKLKTYLSQNPITVQYELAEPIVKTVDLVTVDQDNQPTKLGTFENITNVSLESAGLIPTLEMEVATTISEQLASASPLMDDISTEQQQLETMVDEQSNNVNATMIATTEIFEETL